jgi:hypothetical protein
VRKATSSLKKELKSEFLDHTIYGSLNRQSEPVTFAELANKLFRLLSFPIQWLSFGRFACRSIGICKKQPLFAENE